jgi:hypothetical protein
MSNWIKVREDLFDHPKVHVIASETGLETEHVVGLLVKMWCWFDRHSCHGDVTVTSQGHVVTVSRLLFGQRAEAVLDAIKKVGWIEVEDDHMCIPEFDNWLSGTKARHAASERKRRSRQKLRSTKEGSNGHSDSARDISVTSRGHKRDRVRDTSVTSRPREEKRRYSSSPLLVLANAHEQPSEAQLAEAFGKMGIPPAKAELAGGHLSDVEAKGEELKALIQRNQVEEPEDQEHWWTFEAHRLLLKMRSES